MEKIAICLLMEQKFMNVKDSEIVPNILCLGNVSKHFSEGSMNKTGFSYIYDFSVDYDAIAVDDIWIIHKYLMKKNDIA